MTALAVIETLFAGLAVGFVSALFGLGGAVVMIPYMVLVLHYDQHLAEGTSLIAMVPIAIVGVLAHAKRGYVLFKIARKVAIGGIIGALAGALIAQVLDGEMLQTIYATFSAIVGVSLITKGLREARGQPKPEPD